MLILITDTVTEILTTITIQKKQEGSHEPEQLTNFQTSINQTKSKSKTQDSKTKLN